MIIQRRSLLSAALAAAFRASELFAGIALPGLIGCASNALPALAQHKLPRWQHP